MGQLANHLLPTPKDTSSSQTTGIFIIHFVTLDVKKNEKMGSGCGTVGRGVASSTKEPRFESSRKQFLKTTFGYSPLAAQKRLK